MNSINKQIAHRIKSARLERKMTQQDLADHLSRTSAAISDIERGKTQITANDLFELSIFLNKPIEFFFGENFTGQDIQDLIATLRRLKSPVRTESIATIAILTKMYEVAEKINSTNDETELRGLAIEFYQSLVPFIENINKISAQNKQLQQTLSEVLEVKNLNN